MTSLNSDAGARLLSLVDRIPATYLEPFVQAWRYRELIRAVVRREYLSRFSGSVLGWVWAVLSPLGMLLTYTALFYVTLPQLAAGAGIAEYASNIFVGLIVFNLFNSFIMICFCLIDIVKNMFKSTKMSIILSPSE